MKIDSNEIMQVSVIVKNIEETAKKIADIFGMDVPEPFKLSSLGDVYAEFKGQPTKADIKIAVFKMGPIDFELIEPDEHPSTFKEFLDENGEGIHQFGIVVKNREEALKLLQDNGAETRYWGKYPGGTYHIMDTRDLFGTLVNVKYIED